MARAYGRGAFSVSLLQKGLSALGRICSQQPRHAFGHSGVHSQTTSSTPAASPPLGPGPYYIKVHQRTQTGSAQGELTVDLTVAEAEIAANIPHFGIPASLITTREGEVPPPQNLEIRNSGQGTLDYQIATDQSWLSVWPDQGSSAGETDTVEITVDPTNLEPGAFEGDDYDHGAATCRRSRRPLPQITRRHGRSRFR